MKKQNKKKKLKTENYKNMHKRKQKKGASIGGLESMADASFTITIF